MASHIYANCSLMSRNAAFSCSCITKRQLRYHQMTKIDVMKRVRLICWNEIVFTRGWVKYNSYIVTEIVYDLTDISWQVVCIFWFLYLNTPMQKLSCEGAVRFHGDKIIMFHVHNGVKYPLSYFISSFMSCYWYGIPWDLYGAGADIFFATEYL